MSSVGAEVMSVSCVCVSLCLTPPKCLVVCDPCSNGRLFLDLAQHVSAVLSRGAAQVASMMRGEKPMGCCLSSLSFCILRQM